MRALVLAALLILAAPGAARAAAAPDALATIDACIARLDVQLDVGFERIARRCPELAPALEQSGWAAWLPQGWKESRNDLSAGSLKELRELVSRELATRPATRTPSVEHLKEILADLGSTGQQRGGVWARFKKWVRSLFERAGRQDEEGWLSRLVSRVGVSDAVIEVITYISLGLVVALAGFIVLNELRLAGLLGRRREERAAQDADSLPDRAKVTWRDVEQAPLVDQPRLALELIASRLTDLRRLPPARAFTVRELVSAADLSRPVDREQLREIASTAERVRYAEEDVSPAAVQSVVASARDLMTRLESPAANAPSAVGANA
jgi:uncharacterized protein DUF4129